MISPEEFKKYFDFAFDAHQYHAKKSSMRQFGKVPFIAHPLWCAMMLLNDTRIPFSQRHIGFQVLMLHDVLEDTDKKLPKWVSPEVHFLVHQMTHDSWEEEKKLHRKSDFIKLLKLYDKVASMYDEQVRKDPVKRREWRELIETLLKTVEKRYPEARIVTVAKAVLKDTHW